MLKVKVNMGNIFKNFNEDDKSKPTTNDIGVNTDFGTNTDFGANTNFNLFDTNTHNIHDNIHDNKTWTYCDIIIPSHVKSVISIDGRNVVSQRGSETELHVFKPLYNIDEYKKKFSYVGSDGKLYWKE